MPRKYLFILSPPYSGSTVLWRLLQTSRAVSALPDEGQKLPELRAMMRDDPWNPARHFDWQRISHVWHAHWDLERPVLLEKSPPHLCRPRALLQHFQPAWFLLLQREPLALCEAMHRRNGWDFSHAAGRCIGWLEHYHAARALLPRTLTVFYEDLVADPVSVMQRVGSWMPELADIDVTARVRAHAIDGEQTRGLTDLNPRKLAAIAPADRQRVEAVLSAHRGLLADTPYADR